MCKENEERDTAKTASDEKNVCRRCGREVSASAGHTFPIGDTWVFLCRDCEEPAFTDYEAGSLGRWL